VTQFPPDHRRAGEQRSRASGRVAAAALLNMDGKQIASVLVDPIRREVKRLDRRNGRY
jgi:hypothetical protein